MILFSHLAFLLMVKALFTGSNCQTVLFLLGISYFVPLRRKPVYYSSCTTHLCRRGRKKSNKQAKKNQPGLAGERHKNGYYFPCVLIENWVNYTLVWGWFLIK